MPIFQSLAPFRSCLSAVFLVMLITACSGSGSGDSPEQVLGAGSNNSPSAGDGGDTAGSVCITLYDPVCAKAPTTINCITTPCPTHDYSTYGNRCSAGSAGAEASFDGECESIEDRLAFSDRPIYIFASGELPDTVFETTVLLSSLDGDVLTLEVEYSGGCVEHEFYLSTNGSFMESLPVQLMTVLSNPVEDSCDGIERRTINFDLIPLQELYRKAYQEASGEIMLSDFGILYQW